MPTSPTPTRRRANGKRSGAWITRKRRLAIYLRDHFRCAYCGTDLHGSSPRAITLDHLETRNEGGSHHATNLVTACHGCNSKRRDRPLEAFAPLSAALIRLQAQLPLPLKLAASLVGPSAPKPAPRVLLPFGSPDRCPECDYPTPKHAGYCSREWA